MMKTIIVVLLFSLASLDSTSQIIDRKNVVGSESQSVKKVNDSTFERIASQLGIFKPALYIDEVEKQTSSVALKGRVFLPKPFTSLDERTGKYVTVITDSNSRSGTLFLCARKKNCYKKRKCYKILSKYDFSNSVFNIELDRRRKDLILILQINGESELTSGVFMVDDILANEYNVK